MIPHYLTLHENDYCPVNEKKLQVWFSVYSWDYICIFSYFSHRSEEYVIENMSADKPKDTVKAAKN